MTAYLSTATPNGMAHLVLADEPTPGYTLCGRRASFAVNGTRVSWPRWSPSDRGAAPIQRRQCEGCASRARPRVCTCGAREFPSCLCDLTPREWATAHPDRPLV